MQVLHFELGRTDVYDDRQPGSDAATGDFVYDRPRLPIGRLEVPLLGGVVGGEMRVVLYEAEVRGELVLEGGDRVRVRCVVDALQDVVVVEVSGRREVVQGGVVVPEVAASSWAHKLPSYVFNPAATQEGVSLAPCDEASLTTQKLLSGNGYATALCRVEVANSSASNVTMRYFVSVSAVQAVDEAQTRAVATVQAAASRVPFDKLVQRHRAWWHSYYPASFVTLTDTRVESFYWIQMYKLASATRHNGTLIDLEGPWFVQGTVWPDLHWDLNLQLTYFPMATANRMELLQPLQRFLLSPATQEAFAGNVPFAWQNDSAAAPVAASSLEALETCYWDFGPNCTTSPPSITGNLLWTIQGALAEYRYAFNSTLLKDMLPLLARAVNAYLHFQWADKRGVIHLPPTFSPEYPYRGPDTNYDLALLRWGVTQLLESCAVLCDASDCPEVCSEAQQRVWAQEQAQLVSYPTDEDGYMIAAGVPLNVSHRHWSHLLMVYPLKTIDWSDTSAVELAARSLDHWIGLGGALTGFCRVGASSMSSLLGRADAAFSNITLLLDKYILPNTMYSEAGWPCGETPPAAASSIQDTMLVFAGGTLRVFAGMPSSVPESGFYRLRAEGSGLLVSGQWQNGSTSWVQLEYAQMALAPATTKQVTLDLAGVAGHLSVLPTSVHVSEPSPGLVTIPRADLAQAGTVLLFTNPQPPSALQPAPGTGLSNPWGMKISSTRPIKSRQEPT